MALQRVQVGEDRRSKVDVDDVESPGVVDLGILAIRDGFDLLPLADHALAVQEAGRQLEIGSGRSHGDRHGAPHP